MIVQSRRKFITGLVGLVAAPAVVKASSLMAVRSIVVPEPRHLLGLAPVRIEGPLLSTNHEYFREYLYREIDKARQQMKDNMTMNLFSVECGQ
jgi:hypothetical protein